MRNASEEWYTKIRETEKKKRAREQEGVIGRHRGERDRERDERGLSM
jgi:hypothetical protein